MVAQNASEVLSSSGATVGKPAQGQLVYSFARLQEVHVKLPKSMGACADLLSDIREKRLAADKFAAALKADEEYIKNYIIEHLDKNSTGAAGKHHRIQVVRKRKYRCDPTKWNSFFAYVAKNKRFDLLQKRISDDAVKELVEEGKRKIPGIEPFDYVTVSLTKVG